MSWQIALRLGRVSNVPTVWTNTLAAIVLAGGEATAWSTLALLLATSLAYVGGMYLNDAFDARIDARERPERPIPSGVVSRGTVFGAGFAMLGGCIVILAFVGISGPTGFWPALGGLALASAIVFYDWYHKANPLSPAFMGLCRALVYVAVGLAFTTALPWPLIAAAIVMLCYIVGLTYAAKQESLGRVENLWPLAFLAVPWVYGLWLSTAMPIAIVFFILFSVLIGWALRLLLRRGKGDVPTAVVTLIAGVALLDAIYLAGEGATGWAVVAVVLFAVTRGAQRYIPGT
ncbi:UbiA family prenyltransferase [Microbaculum sp. FT89]|uniref:UbiA family prenyltransferase n=1 Tax=Microbaculum sp. FT89 TaxID=3447298 RepID=UPI003F52E3B2